MLIDLLPKITLELVSWIFCLYIGDEDDDDDDDADDDDDDDKLTFYDDWTTKIQQSYL